MNVSRLMQELKQTKTFELPEFELYFNLIKTYDQIFGAVSQLLKQDGLTPAQFNVLRILSGSGKEGRQCHEIRERLITRVPDVTRLIDRLEEKHLVERIRSTRDRRVIKVAITDEGRKLVKKIDAPMKKVQKEQLGHLSDKEQQQLNDLLYKIRYKE